MPFDFPLPKFYACPHKKDSREATIIARYRQYFGKTLPKDKQYWTMCSMQTDDKGVFQEGSELGQMLASGILTENQFYGVDIMEDFITANRNAKPKAHWLRNDFEQQMKIAYKEGWFNPAIVFADLLNMTRAGVQTVSNIMCFLEDKNIHNVMLVANMMITNPHARRQISEAEAVAKAQGVVDAFGKVPEFKHVWRNDTWKAHPEYYLYNGSGNKSTTRLVTYIFYKNDYLS